MDDKTLQRGLHLLRQEYQEKLAILAEALERETQIHAKETARTLLLSRLGKTGQEMEDAEDWAASSLRKMAEAKKEIEEIRRVLSEIDSLLSSSAEG